MRLKPMNQRIIVREAKAEEKSAGGIIIPSNAQDKPQEGYVVAVGPGKLLEDGTRSEMAVKIGDKVIYGKYAPTEIKLDGELHLVISEADVLAIVDEGQPENPRIFADCFESTDSVQSVEAEIITKATGSAWLSLRIDYRTGQSLCTQEPINQLAQKEIKQWNAVLSQLPEASNEDKVAG